MHRLIQDHLEEVLAGKRFGPDHPAGKHLQQCGECRDEVAAMQEHAGLLREWRVPAEAEPRPGFYARVIDRIETQGAGSVWGLFFESAFSRRIAFASLALALLMGVYLVSTEQTEEQEFQVAGDVDPVLMVSDLPGQLPPAIPAYDPRGVMLTGLPDQDAVLVNLVTYREQ